MSNLRNSVRLIGNLGAAPEIKTVGNDKKMAKFSMATNETYRNDKGEMVKETYWHNVVAWGKTAELAEKFLQKGSEVAIEGKLTSRTFTDKEGNKRYFTEVLLSELLVFGMKPQ
ncbi:MAG: single-stranded DNA-binding protein [Chitinophagales bacterium]